MSRVQHRRARFISSQIPARGMVKVYDDSVIPPLLLQKMHLPLETPGYEYD